MRVSRTLRSVNERVLEAVTSGDGDLLQSALDDDPAAVDARDETGVSAVLLARYRNRVDLVELLVAAGAELDIFDAAGLGATERLRQLLDEHQQPVSAWSADGFTPLHLAAFFRNRAVAELLLDHGADVEAVSQNDMRVTPLHSAAAGGDTAICRLLIERDADVSARQEGGFTPLHAAAHNGDLELARLLVERGADPTARTDDGRTPADFLADGATDELAALVRTG